MVVSDNFHGSSVEKRRCRKCNIEYPLNSDNFSRGGKKNGTFIHECRKCKRKVSATHHQQNPEKMKERVHRRKVTESLAAGSYSDLDVGNIRAALRDCCRYCGVKLNGGGEVDHITPISRGGTNWPDNITLACVQCNREKHGKNMEEYAVWRKANGLSAIRKMTGAKNERR